MRSGRHRSSHHRKILMRCKLWIKLYKRWRVRLMLLSSRKRSLRRSISSSCMNSKCKTVRTNTSSGCRGRKNVPSRTRNGRMNVMRGPNSGDRHNPTLMRMKSPIVNIWQATSKQSKSKLKSNKKLASSRNKMKLNQLPNVKNWKSRSKRVKFRFTRKMMRKRSLASEGRNTGIRSERRIKRLRKRRL